MSIDQSLSCSGVIVWKKGKPIFGECIKTTPKEEVVIRIREIILRISDLATTHNIKTIVVESLPFGLNSTSVRPLAGLHMCIQNMCEDLNIEFTESNVTAVKKFATGKGNAKKEDMVKAFETDHPKLHNEMVLKGYKKTTGLADLADSYWIYKKYKDSL
jgi:Holliday junction resolvasome RuvABC endonuclease subunit